MPARARHCVSAACYIVHCLRESEARRDEAGRERQAQSLPRERSRVSAERRQLLGLCDLASVRQKERMYSVGRRRGEQERERETEEG